jgi:nucleoid DNA-binding protein
MDHAQFVRRISAASGIPYEETERVVALVLRELCGAASRGQPVDFGTLGRFEPDRVAPSARFRPASVHGALGRGCRD